MGFKPHNIPLTSGIRLDLSNATIGNPQLLEDAGNVICTHKASLIGRPGLVSVDAFTQENNTGSIPDNPSINLSVQTAGLIAAGLETYNDQILALYQSTAYARTSIAYNGVNFWRNLGSFWSVNKSQTPALDYRSTRTLTTPVAVGKNLSSILTTTNTSSGFSFTNTKYLNILDTQGNGNFDATSALHACIASNTNADVMIYPKADGSIRYHVTSPSSTMGSGTEVLIAAAGSVNIPGAGIGQSCWIIPGQIGAADEFFFAYKSSTAGSIVIGRLTIASGVTATLTLTGLGTINWGVCLCHNGGITGSTGKLALSFNDFGVGYKSKIITCTSTSVLTDAAINQTYSTTNALAYLPHTIGNNAAGGFLVCYNDNTSSCGNLLIWDNLYSANLPHLWATLYNLDNSSLKIWMPLIPARVFAARNVIGLQLKDAATSATQWQILELPANLVSTNQGGPRVIAVGIPNGGVSTPAINSVVTDSTDTINNGTSINYKFGFVEGITFDSGGVQTSGSTIITLTTKASRSTSAGGITIFSGATLYQYDGNQCYPLNFVEGAPVLSAAISAGGAGVAGSYSWQAIWEITNSQGQIIRSGQSNIATTVIIANATVPITVSIPQVTGRYLLGTTLRVKIYVTSVNPPAGAPLYLIATVNAPVTGGAPNASKISTTLFTSSGAVDTTQEQLYTGGNVFNDQAPYTADRGVAFAAGRLWTAGANKLFVSKLLRANINPAFTNSGALSVDVPTKLGEVHGLGSLGDKLVAICDNGVLLVFGAGFDDLGNGPGYNTDIIISGGYTNKLGTGPRSATDIQGIGVAYLGKDNEIYVINSSGISECISRVVKANFGTALISTDICYCGPLGSGSSNNEEHGPWLIIDGNNGFNQRVYDIESGQWYLWSNAKIGVGTYCTALNGVVFMQGSDNKIYSYSSWYTGQDLGVGFTASIRTGKCSIAGNEDGYPVMLWGRLRGITINSTIYQPYSLLAQVTAGDNFSFLMNKTTTITSGQTAHWPYDTVDEFRTTIQRCNIFRIILQATPGSVEWASIDYWAYASEDRTPSRLRH